MLCVNKISLTLNKTSIFNNISLNARYGDIIGITGASGIGKTSFAKCILGLYKHDGIIMLDDVILSQDNKIYVPPYKRDFGVCFQDHLLLPFYNVEKNILLGVKNTNESYLKELMNIMAISHLRHEEIQRLSGGEQQRVALCRALIRKPKVLIMDEPFSNLDITLKENIINDLKSILLSMKIITLMISHDDYEINILTSRHYDFSMLI